MIKAATAVRFGGGSGLRRPEQAPGGEDGNCSPRQPIPPLVELVRSGALGPAQILTEVEAMQDVIAANETFDAPAPSWTEVEFRPDV